MKSRVGAMFSSRERLLDAAKYLIAQKGFGDTTTAEIARLAATSESQLIKHFGDKQGILQAIFEYAWEQINPALRLAIARIPSPTEKIQIIFNMVLTYMEGDDALRSIFLLQARRVRREGHKVIVAEGYREFIGILDAVLEEMATSKELQPGIHPQAFRSALMGAI